MTERTIYLAQAIGLGALALVFLLRALITRLRGRKDLADLCVCLAMGEVAGILCGSLLPSVLYSGLVHLQLGRNPSMFRTLVWFGLQFGYLFSFSIGGLLGAALVFVLWHRKRERERTD